MFVSHAGEREEEEGRQTGGKFIKHCEYGKEQPRLRWIMKEVSLQMMQLILLSRAQVARQAKEKRSKAFHSGMDAQ